MTTRDLQRLARDLGLVWARFACVVCLLLTACGCQSTKGIRQDDFPVGVPCVQARNDAIQWYQAKFHKTPTIRPTRVIVTDKPPFGYGGCTSIPNYATIDAKWK